MVNVILTWIRILNHTTVRLFGAILDPRYQMSPSVGCLFFYAGPVNWYFGVNPFLFNLWSTPRKWPLFSTVFLLQQWRVKGPLLLTYILLTKLFPLDFLSERLVNLLRFSVADVLSLMSFSSVTNLPLPLSYSCSFALADPHKTTKNYKLKICFYNQTL